MDEAALNPDSLPATKPTSRRRLFVLGLAIVALVLMFLFFLCWYLMIYAPGESFQGQPSEFEKPQVTLRDELYEHVDHLSVRIGERNLANYPALQKAANYVQQQLEASGYEVARQEFEVNKLACFNLDAGIRGRTSPDEVVLIGAHYDTAPKTPGANDNASGIAALLALARHFSDVKTDRTLRFVAFTNEEPPYFHSERMGSLVYARRSREWDENLVAVLSLETIGYFTNEPNSQLYPAPFDAFYPAEGSFIGIVGNVSSRPLVHRVIDSFRRHAEFPSEAGALPGNITGVGWSDHWSFWQEGYQAVMITDTAPFRYPYYHHVNDTPDKLQFEEMTRVVEGLKGVVEDLTSSD